MDTMSSPSPEAAVKPRKGPRGNKRARLVCLRCHEKKIKCDLQVNNTERDSPRCTKCELAGYECRIRPSKRGGGNHSANKPSSLDGFDNSGILPLLPMAYDVQGPSVTGVASSSAGLANAKPSSNLDAASHDEPLVSVSHLSPRADRQSAHSRPRKVPSAQNVLTSGAMTAAANELRDVADQNPSYIGESGYMEIFSEDRTPQIDRSTSSQPPLKKYATDLPPPALQESFIETYFEYCYTWCPILERSSLLREPGVSDSILLKQALALLGSRIEPPVIPHARPSVYYERAKSLFYGNYEKNPVTCLRALCLFYYWGSAPNTISLDTVWWWTGVAIRQAQQIGLHREPKPGYPMRFNETLGLRRRIWWTLFARERLTSICQGRPCIIDPSDCNVQEPTIEDFPEPRNIFRAQIFIYWVRLCGIVGRVAKYLSQRTESTQFPTHLARELIDWIQTLPDELQLPIATNRTTPFNRDIHQLHLPYLTTITLLYLAKSSQPLPRAYTAAVLSASCVARIFEDYLARGSIRFLQGMAGWHISVAILALLHARRVESLTEAADNHIRLLRIALKEMAKMWHSASMFDKGFNRLLGTSEFHVSDARLATNGVDLRAGGGSLSELADLATGNLINWMDFFPFATVQTSPLVEILLTQNSSMTFSDVEWPGDLALQLHDLFDTFEGPNDGVFGLAG